MTEEPTAPDPRTAAGQAESDDGAAAEHTGEIFSIGAAFGGVSGLLDSGLPGVLFVATYAFGGQDMRLALIVALASGVVLAVLRVVRRQSLQHAIAGFLGVAIAAYIASRTGRAQDFFLPSILRNGGFALAYAISIVVRWPLIGVLVAAVQQQGMGWRRDPVLLRAYSYATWVWVGLFVVRLGVMWPLYLAGALVPLGVAQVALGVPAFLVTIWLTYVVIKASVPAHYRVRQLPAPGAKPDAAPTPPTP